MKSLQLMLAVLAALVDNGLVIPSAQRIEIKTTRSGARRLYIAPAPNFTQAMMGPVHQLLEGRGVTVNSFAKADLVTGITFVDDTEDQQEA